MRFVLTVWSLLLSVLLQTLCLLCSSLAWQESYTAAAEEIGPAPPFLPGAGGASGSGQAVSAALGMMGALGVRRPNSAPKIIYASRTHTQLSQVIQELKGSGYAPKIAVLGSREQLCAHREVRSVHGTRMWARLPC